MAKSKTVREAIKAGTLPDVPLSVLERIRKLRHPAAAMLRDDVKVSEALDLIDGVERGAKFKGRGKAADAALVSLRAHLAELDGTAAELWNHLVLHPPTGWRFIGDPTLRPNACTAEYKGKPRFGFPRFRNILTR